MELPAEDQITKLMDLLEIPKKKRNFEELQDQIQMLKTFYQSKTANTLEKILNNPGLQHLAENIVENLTHKDLKMFGEINQSSKRILDKPRFLLRKFSGLSKEDQKDWIKKIESAQNSGKANAIISYMKWMFKKETFFLPCYSRPVIQYCFRQTLQDISKTIGKLSDEDTELVKMMASLIFNYLPDRRLCTQLVHVHSGISKLPLIFEKSQFGLDYTFVDLLRILYLLNCWKDSKKPFTNDYYSFERQWILYFWLMSGKL